MALTTRAKVLQRLGLTDDAATSGAISVGRKTATTATIGTTSTALTVSVNGGGTTSYTLATAAHDTLTKLIAVVNAAHAEIELELVAGVAGATASTLLDASQSIALSSSNGTGILTYSNVAAGTTAALIDALIASVDGVIARYCGRMNPTTGAEEFSSASLDEYYSGSGEEVIPLRSFPVSSITSITLYGPDGSAVSTLDSSAYRLDSARGRLRWLGSGVGDGYPVWDVPIGTAYGRYRVGWPRGFQNIRVQYTAGYSTIPADLEHVATSMVAGLYLNTRTNPNASSDSLGGQSTSYRSAEDLLSLHRAALAPYRTVLP